MRITQGTFSYLPDLTDEEIAAQVRYALANGWSTTLEHTDDPHPRNPYWETWGMPLFDARAPGEVLDALRACRTACPGEYVRLSAFDRSLGRQTTAMSFLVQRPDPEPRLRLDRADAGGGRLVYTLRPA